MAAAGNPSTRLKRTSPMAEPRDTGRTSDGMVEVDLHLPAELGGDGGGTNPEELFAVGFAACFESALGVVARRRNWRAATLRSIPR